MQAGDLGGAAASTGSSDLMPTTEYLEVEREEVAKCTDMFKIIRTYEASRTINLQVWRPPCRPVT